MCPGKRSVTTICRSIRRALLDQRAWPSHNMSKVEKKDAIARIQMLQPPLDLILVLVLVLVLILALTLF